MESSADPHTISLWQYLWKKVRSNIFGPISSTQCFQYTLPIIVIIMISNCNQMHYSQAYMVIVNTLLQKEEITKWGMNKEH